MTTVEKNAAWLVERLRERLPDADITVHKPKRKDGGWMIDAHHGDHYVAVQWIKAAGFGVSTPREDPLYSGDVDETIVNADEALARVEYLLRSGVQAGIVTLDELRALLGASQVELANAMNVSQSMVSQTENREDIMLSTLQSYIQGLGGTLEVVAKFKNGTYSLDVGAHDSPRHSRDSKKARR